MGQTGLILQQFPEFQGQCVFPSTDTPKPRAKVIMIATKDSFEPHSSEQLPNSQRVYLAGQLHADVRVPMREIRLTPTKGFNGQTEINEPVCVYDCSGPWGDPQFTGTVEQGLPALRRDWILERGDVTECAGRE